MRQQLKRKSWTEPEKYQLLLAYRVGAPVAQIACVLHRTEKSVYRALERFYIAGPQMLRARAGRSMFSSKGHTERLHQLFDELGLASDPLFDKGFFCAEKGQILYRPPARVRARWAELQISIQPPWQIPKARTLGMAVCAHRRKVREYTLQDVMRFLRKSGGCVRAGGEEGAAVMRGRFQTPLGLLYRANQMRLMRGMTIMLVPGVTQD